MPVNTKSSIPSSPICIEDRITGKRIALPQEISADPWKEGNADGRQRPWREVGREVGWSHSSDEAANPRGAKGAMKMRTMKTEQLNLVFAEGIKPRSRSSRVSWPEPSPAPEPQFTLSASEIPSKEPDA